MAAVEYHQEGAIVIMTLNQPALRNPISEPEMIDALIDALSRMDADPAVRCGILTGAGAAFSAGGNLKKMGGPEGPMNQTPAANRRWYIEGIQRIPLAFEALEVPVIAAVNGPAVGAGCDLACMCDIRIAGRSARFAESFVKMGLVPGDGGAWLLPRVVGQSKAREMALTGDMLDAEEALACGLVSQVVDDDKLLPAAIAIAQRIAANPPRAVRLTKRLMNESQMMSLSSALQVAASFQSLMHATEDHREAVNAFLEKRPPQFTGN